MVVVLSKELVEYLRDAVDRSRLKDRIIWSVHLLEVGSSEHRNRGGEEKLAVVVSCNVQRVCSTVDINFVGELRLLLSQ